MCHLSAFFIATLLLFSTIPVSLAQQQIMQSQAETDAHTDIKHDMKEILWFTAGLVGSSAGTVTGCASGGLVGLLISSETNCISAIFDDPIESCSIAGTILFGVLAVPICVHLYPHSPTPPPERLLGKPPEYVAAYTHAYRSKAISLRKRWVTAGSIASNLGVLTIILRFEFGE